MPLASAFQVGETRSERLGMLVPSQSAKVRGCKRQCSRHCRSLPGRRGLPDRLVLVPVVAIVIVVMVVMVVMVV